MQPQARS